MISISIVIPVYNVEKYVERCLNSVENQNYNGKLDCIIVDDCGNDNSMSLVNAFVYSHQNSRINYIILSHTQNRGLSEARNTGIRESTSDYIFFLDSDDEIPYNAMSLLANEVHKHPEIDIVMGFMYSATKNDYYNIEKYRNHQYITDPNWLRYQSFKDGENIQVTACNKLTKKKFITENNLFFYPNIIHEDNLWMFFRWSAPEYRNSPRSKTVLHAFSSPPPPKKAPVSFPSFLYTGHPADAAGGRQKVKSWSAPKPLKSTSQAVPMPGQTYA